MRPCRATRAATRAPPLPNFIIFFHTILHKQNNHLHAIHPNDINRPTRNLPKRNQPPMRNPQNGINHPMCNPPKRNRRGGAYVPARTSAQRRFHAKNRFCVSRIVHGELNDGCALMGRHGRAHRHRPTHLHHIFPRIPHKQNSVHVQSAPTKLHQTARCGPTPSGLYFR